MLNSLDLRNANSTMVTDHIAVKSNELLQLEDDLRKLRRQNEEFKRQAIQTQIQQEREKLRTELERISFDKETPQYMASTDPSCHKETLRNTISQRDTHTLRQAIIQT